MTEVKTVTQAEALRWIATLFEEDSDRLTPETPRNEIPVWDSLGALTLMAGLDNDFSIVLSDDDLLGLTSVGEILAVLKRNGRLT
jgi:acyl carrier protein